MPFGRRSTAGKLFGASGGVTEAALRTAYFLLTGEDAAKPEFEAVRGFQGVKKTKVSISGLELSLAVVSGLDNARRLLEEVRAGREQLHFIEVMTCPGGCIAGGGQALGADTDAIHARMAALYRLDQKEGLRAAHHNEDVKHLYQEFLGEPLSHKSHELLHTHYESRAVLT